MSVAFLDFSEFSFSACKFSTAFFFVSAPFVRLFQCNIPDLANKKQHNIVDSQKSRSNPQIVLLLPNILLSIRVCAVVILAILICTATMARRFLCRFRHRARIRILHRRRALRRGSGRGLLRLRQGLNRRTITDLRSVCMSCVCGTGVAGRTCTGETPLLVCGRCCGVVYAPVRICCG